MRIGTRIAVGFAVILSLTVSVAVIGWNALASYSRAVEREARVTQLDTTLSQARLEEAHYMLDTDPVAVRQVRELLARARTGTADLLADQSGVDATAHLQTVQTLLNDYGTAFDQVVLLEVERLAMMERLRRQIALLSIAAHAIQRTGEKSRTAIIEGLRQLDPGESGEMDSRLTELAEADFLTTMTSSLIQEARGVQGGILQYLLDNGQRHREQQFEGMRRLADVTVQAMGSGPSGAVMAELTKLAEITAAIELEFKTVVEVLDRQRIARVGMRTTAEKVGQQVSGLTSSLTARREHDRTDAVWLIGGGASGALLLGGILAFLIGRSLVRPIRDAADAVQRLSRGDLGVRAPGLGREDELGAIGQAIARMIAVLGGLRLEMVRLSGGLTPAGDASGQDAPLQTMSLAEADLNDQAEFEGAFGDMVDLMRDTGIAFRAIGEQATQVAVAAGQASDAVSQVSAGALEQTGNLDLVSGAVGQSVAAIAHVSDSTRHASEMMQTAAGFAQRGKEDMTRLLAVSRGISDNSRRIGRITEAITQIAVKTNILSVNASIEAARAGEAGRGFEVVAEEVGKLADNAVESARQIADIIEAASNMAQEGMTVTSQAQRMMDNLADQVGKIDQLFQSVAVALDEQQVSVRDIEANMDSVRGVASRNATASEEIAATMRQLSRLADDTRLQVSRFTGTG